jgi:1-acyl-sn-glycerol-3-phosphate acyltransferase
VSGWRITSPCGPGCLPRPGTTPRASLPLQLARYAGVLAMLTLSVPLALTLPLAGPSIRTWVIRSWLRGLLLLLGVRHRVTGDPRLARGRTLVVANHVSWLDIPALAVIQPLPILAKREVASWPLVGTLARLAGTLYIDRDRLRPLPGTVGQLAQVLSSGGSLVVFPGGTTLCGRTPGRFRHATFQAAVDTGAVVRPVAITYRLLDGRPSTIAAYVGDDSLLASLHRVIATKGLVVEVAVLPPIEATGLDRRTLTQRAAAAVARADAGQANGSGSSGTRSRSTLAPSAASCGTKSG